MTAWIRGRDKDRGFTLVEVVIATGLLALLSLMILSGASLAFRFWDRADASRAAIDDIAFAQAFLRRSLEAAYPALTPSSAGDAVVDFSGSDGQIKFLAPAFQSVAAAGIVEIALRAVAAPGGAQLVVEFERMKSAGQAIAFDVVAETLVADVHRIRFSYLPHDGGGWRNEWRGEARLPKLIRIEIDMAPGDRRRWPPLLIAPMIDVDQSCRYDPLTKYCQGRRR